ncbi:metallophosphoesterase [Yoonia sp.]|uniref:metallophosphoesterase n=1 Tax=Yoonia sp. TaxID=2212373 RepID=UPI00358F925D
MKGWFGNMLSHCHSAGSATVMPDMRPDEPFYAVGDLHGSTSLLIQILRQIADAGHLNDPVVFVGDYVDRGEDTAGTLAHLYALAEDPRRRTVFLKGNHEQMLLDFLDAPEVIGDFWLKSGGKHALASFGIDQWSETKPREFTLIRDELRTKIGDDIEQWLRGLPVSWQSGNIFLSHAGADPSCSLGAQTNDRLLWGLGGALPSARRDGFWTVQGHKIVQRPVVAEGQVFIDTGAYATGKLTAARFYPGGVSFLST